MKKIILLFVIFLPIALFFDSCLKDDDDIPEPTPTDILIDWDTIEYSPTGKELEGHILVPPIPTNSVNPLTKEGVHLGRMLFYDPILSGDSTQACASCHNQEFGFTDNEKTFSEGIDGIEGNRNSMAIINLVWKDRFFWAGRSGSLEEQALEPVPNPIEMHLEWGEAIVRLMRNVDYRVAFYKAFGIKTIQKEDVANALAQFERTLISIDAPYDQYYLGLNDDLSEDAIEGRAIFFSEVGDCFHCHGNDVNNLFAVNLFANDGLDSAEDYLGLADKGLGSITGNEIDNGMFRVPTLRNIELTAPYMHDGRFQTLEEVVEHYDSGMKYSPNLDPNFAVRFKNGVYQGLGLTEKEKRQLVTFLESLTDTAFINNPDFSSPFE
ncbi:MAG: cytochrome-c peroxidase [Chitinophagales bacterium]